jgi:sugar/nucleoside kinase (ribokinase family)
VARIVVVGSVAQDDVVWLEQPLHEGRHLEGRRRQLRLGGGGANTAIPLRLAGHEVALVAPVGADPLGEWLLAKLQQKGVDVSAVQRVSGESTRSLVLLDPTGERTIVNLHRCREDGPPERLRRLPADAIYVRSRDRDLAPLLAERVGSTPVVAHVPPLAACSRPASVLVGSVSDLPPEFLAAPWSAGRAIAGEALRWVVITLGAQGAHAYGPEARLEVPAPVVPVVDSTAAGDVFAAGLVHALALGRTMEAALQTAVAWGAATVSCPGLPTREVIQALA